MSMKQRLYVDGKLTKTSRYTSPETVRKWLDNLQADWTKNGLFPLTAPGQFDMNQCHSCVRVSDDELIIVSTSGKTLRFFNVSN